MAAAHKSLQPTKNLHFSPKPPREVLRVFKKKTKTKKAQSSHVNDKKIREKKMIRIPQANFYALYMETSNSNFQKMNASLLDLYDLPCN